MGVETTTLTVNGVKRVFSMGDAFGQVPYSETLLETLHAEDDEVVEGALRVLVKCVDCGLSLPSLLRSVMEVTVMCGCDADAAGRRELPRGARVSHPPHALQVHERTDGDVAAGGHHCRNRRTCLSRRVTTTSGSPRSSCRC